MEYVYDDEYNEDSIATKRILKEIRKEYVKSIINLIKDFDCFRGENAFKFATMLWVDIKKSNRSQDDVTLLETLEKAVNKSKKALVTFGLQDGFKAFHYIFKVHKSIITGEQSGAVEEGEYV